jgi:3'(2'), 5'-bisphosphate nucleotidase
MGSSLKFTKIAENEAHIYPRLAPTCEWDTAAPHIVVTEAGGEIVHAGACLSDGTALEPLQEALEKNLPVIYNKENDLNPFSPHLTSPRLGGCTSNTHHP